MTLLDGKLKIFHVPIAEIRSILVLVMYPKFLSARIPKTVKPTIDNVIFKNISQLINFPE